MLAFEIAGGVEAGRRFVEALTLHSHVANIGDVRSPGHPPGVHDPLAGAATKTGSRPASRPGWCGSPSGIEHIDDILADLDQGFIAAKGA